MAIRSGKGSSGSGQVGNPAEVIAGKIGLLNQEGGCRLRDASISEHEAIGREWVSDQDLEKKE
jgi:hypothetical protein